MDAIHDTVHEMAKDEARHGKGFEGLYNRLLQEVIILPKQVISILLKTEELPQGNSRISLPIKVSSFPDNR